MPNTIAVQSGKLRTDTKRELLFMSLYSAVKNRILFGKLQITEIADRKDRVMSLNEKGFS